MRTPLRRRLNAHPWMWAVVAVLGIAVMLVGVNWVDGRDIRTADRETWARRIVILGGIGLFGVELARRLKWWLGIVAAALLAGFVFGGLNLVIDEVRLDRFGGGDRRPTASGPPMDADVAIPVAAGLADEEAWERLELTLQPVLTGLTQPIAVEPIPGTDRFVVLQREGEIRLISEGETGGTTILDLGDETTLDGERGLFDIAIGPVDGRLYVSFSDLEGDNRVISFEMTDDGLTDRQEILEITQPFRTHNGGGIDFDAQGYLVMGVGDGGRLHDPLLAGQDRTNRLGTILRIAPLVTGGYEIPPDNPYLDDDGIWPEIYAYGLRNPWRVTTDPVTGDIWIGDVGQDSFEEINRIPFGSNGGENFGWNIREGPEVHRGKASDPTGYTDADTPADNVEPAFSYAHDPAGIEGARNSVTGGHVYRGDAIPLLRGTYFYADFTASFIGAVLFDESGEVVGSRTVLDEVPAIVSFGVDHDDELLIVSLGGEISRLVEP